MSARVGILGMGMITPGGRNVDETWQSLLDVKDTTSSRLCPDGVARTVHTIGNNEDLFFNATHAADAAYFDLECQFGQEVGHDTLCVGSSSDTVALRESSTVTPYLGLLLADRMAAYYDIENKYQFGNACASSSYAIATAMDLIRTGQSIIALAGGADEVTYSSMAGFSAWRVYGNRCLPFAADRHGLVLADGAAFLVLAPEDVGVPIAYLTGVGLASDATNMAAMSAGTVERVMEDAIREAEPDDSNRIDAIITHGTGTQSNDSAESEAIVNVFGGEMPLVCSYKHVLGHPQGASGAIGVVLAVQALLTQTLFPTIAKDKLDPDLEVSFKVTTEVTKADLAHILVLSHGSWGVYSALVVESA